MKNSALILKCIAPLWVSLAATMALGQTAKPVKLDRSDHLYLDVMTGTFYKAKGVVGPEDLYLLCHPNNPSNPNNPNFDKVKEATAAYGSSVQVIVLNVCKTKAKVNVKGTSLTSVDNSGLTNITSLLKALEGSGLSASLIPTTQVDANSVPDNMKAFTAAANQKKPFIEKVLQDCNKIESRAAEVKTKFEAAVSPLTIPTALEPLRQKGNWVSDDKKRDDISYFDEEGSAGLNAISVAYQGSTQDLIRTAFKARIEAARAVLVSGKALEKKYVGYQKHLYTLFADVYVCDPTKPQDISGTDFQLDVDVVSQDAKADPIGLSGRLHIATTGAPPSFFAAVSPFGYGRIVQNKFTVVNNAAVQTSVENRYGFDNLAYTFNYQPAGSDFAVAFGFTHAWNDLKNLSTNNVGLLLGVSYWKGAYGLTLGYVDLPVEVLGTNGSVAAVSDIQTRYSHTGSWFLGFSFKVGGSSGASTAKAAAPAATTPAAGGGQ